ncbi:MAG: YidC/Oxa1 family membrane protein insertase [Patescibacteria group bacterium]
MYNGLIFLIDILPWADAGVAIIVFTLIIKLILFPLSKKAVYTQLKMKKVEPQLRAIKEKYSGKDQAQEQAKQTMAFYKREGIRPFAGILLIFIQLPILFALYKAFLHPGLPNIDVTLLYSFVIAPMSESINMHFLGLFDIAGKSIALALIAAVSTYFQVRFSMPPLPPKKATSFDKDGKPIRPNFQEDFARGMNIQMRYVFPVIAFFISWSISGAIALYWITSNLFTIAQELVIRKSFARNESRAEAKKNLNPAV